MKLQEKLDQARNDPRTIEDMKAAEWAHTTAVRSTAKTDTGWWVELEGGTSFFLKREKLGDREPLHSGDEVRLYTDRGSMVRGMDLRGEELWWETPLERLADDVKSLADNDRKKREAYAREAPALEKRVQALPPEFQSRIAKYRKNNPTFDRDYLSYELFCCEQAVVFAAQALERHQENRDEVRAFWDTRDQPPQNPLVRWLMWWAQLPYERQTELMPEMGRGHSGNTFGSAVSLASIYLESPERVAARYGSLAPLVGSDEYGDDPPEAA